MNKQTTVLALAIGLYNDQRWRWRIRAPRTCQDSPVLPHVILLPDASPAMLPAGLGLVGFEVSYKP